MTPEQKHYDDLLDDVCRAINRLKSELSPYSGLTMAQEVQRHLNRVVADLNEQRYNELSGQRWFE